PAAPEVRRLENAGLPGREREMPERTGLGAPGPTARPAPRGLGSLRAGGDARRLTDAQAPGWWAAARDVAHPSPLRSNLTPASSSFVSKKIRPAMRERSTGGGGWDTAPARRARASAASRLSTWNPKWS